MSQQRVKGEKGRPCVVPVDLNLFFFSCQMFNNKYSTKNMHYLQVADAPLKQPWKKV